jgi:predicted metal-dependent HD superfamily phosphohydrolase
MENQLSGPADPMCEPLRSAWADLLRPFGAPAAEASAVLDELLRLYSASGRFYHNLRHLDEVLRAVDGLAPLATDLAAVRFAAWFHDAIYNPHAADNEEHSATLCVRALGRLRIPPATVAAATGMIRATKTHQPPPGDRDCLILLDADLAILGASPSRYAEYAADIRREYAWLPEADYRTGRRHVLQSFLQRERIYLTEPMFARRETQARQNLEAEIETLK